MMLHVLCLTYSKTNLNLIHELQAQCPEGQSKLNEFLDCTHQTLASTSDAGQAKLNQEATQLNDRWEKVLAKVAKSEAKLEKSLQQKEEHNMKKNEFEKWLAEKEVELEECFVLQADLPGKEGANHRCKRLVEDIAQQEPWLAELTHSAQQLLDTNIESISVRFHTLKNRANESSEHAYRALDHHRQFNQSMDYFQSWLAEAEQVLDDNKDVPPRMDRLKQQLQNLKNLEQSQDVGRQKVDDIATHADLVLASTAPPGQTTVQHYLNSQQQDLMALAGHTAQAKDQLQGVLEKWEEHSASCKKLSDWLMTAETTLVNLEKPCVYLEEKKTQLDKLMTLEENVVSHQADVEVVTPQAQQLTLLGVSDPGVSARAQDITDEYQDLCSRLKVALQQREEQVAHHQQLANQLQDMNDWLKAKQLELDQCSGLAADREANEDRIQQLQVVLATLPEGEAQLQSSMDQSAIVCPSTAPAGRDRIDQQLQMAADRLKALRQQAERSQHQLEEGAELQRNYEGRAKELREWMAGAEGALGEAELEGEVGEGQLEVKQAHLEKVKALCDESQELQPIRAQVTSLGQQLIASNPTAVHIGSETTRLTAGYQTLHMNLKDRLRQAERAVTEQQNFQSAVEDFYKWLRAARETLTNCRNVTGEKPDVSSRLQDLQELMSMRHRGQSLLNSASSKAERVLPQTAPDGQEAIQAQIAVMRGDYASLLEDTISVKDALESCVRDWNRYEASCDKLSRWLAEAKGQIRTASELKSTLGEKKVQLERSKAIQQDIASHQKDIDALTEHAKKLLDRNPDGLQPITEELQMFTDQYQASMDNIKLAVDNHALSVAEHKEFQQGQREFANWLREAKNKLTSLTDVSGNSKTVQAKLAALEDLLTAKEAGQEKLDSVTGSGGRTLPLTAAAGQETITQQLQKDQEELAALMASLLDSRDRLKECAGQWDVYEESQAEMDGWLRELEEQLGKGLELQPGLETKREQVNEFKALQETIQSRQPAVEAVSRQAQSLLDSSVGNVGVVSESTRLASRFQRLIMTAKDQLKKSEHNAADHAQYQDALNDFNSWLASSQEALDQNSGLLGDKLTLQDRAKNLKDLAATRGTGHNLLQALDHRAGKTLPNTAVSGQELLRQDTRAAHAALEELAASLIKQTQDLQQCLSLWDDFDGQYSQVTEELGEAEVILVKEPELAPDVKHKEQQLNRYQSLADEVAQQKESLDCLWAGAKELQRLTEEDEITKKATEMMERHKKLMQAAKAAVETTFQRAENHREYNDLNRALCHWLESTNQALRHHSCLAGTKDTLNQQLASVTELISDVPSCEEKLMQPTQALGGKVLAETSPDGCAIVQQELDQSSRDWSRLVGDADDIKLSLEGAICQWEEYEEEHERLVQRLNEAEAETSQELELKKDVAEKQEQLESLKIVYEDVLSLETSLNAVVLSADPILNNNPMDSTVSGQLSQARLRHQTLVNTMKAQVKLCQERVQDHTDFSLSLEESQSILSEAEQRLSPLQDISGDRPSVDAKLAALETMASHLTEFEAQVRCATDQGHHILPHTSPEGQEVVQGQVADLSVTLTSLVHGVKDAGKALVERVRCWSEYETAEEEFGEWLAETEKVLTQEPERKADLGEKKSQLERYKALESEITSHSINLQDAEQKALKVLEHDTGSVDVEGKTADLRARYQALCLRSKDVTDALTHSVTEHQGYQDALQEAEKALLDISQQLTTQGALPEGASLEDSQQQLSQLQGIMRQITACSAKLDQASVAGSALTSSAQATPTLTQHVGVELRAVEEGLEAVNQTANSIQARLQDLINQQQVYKETLQTCADWLQVAQQGWSVDEADAKAAVVIETEGLEDAQNQLKELQALLDTAVMHSQLVQAAEESLEDSSADLSTSQLSADVHQHLTVVTETVEARIAVAQQLSKQWKELEERKARLGEWLEQARGREEEERLQPAEVDVAKAKAHLDGVEDFLKEVKAKQAELAQIRDEQSHLCHRPDPDLDALDQGFKTLSDLVEQLADARRGELEDARGYLEARSAVEKVLDEAQKTMEEMEKDDFMPISEKLEKHQRTSSLLAERNELDALRECTRRVCGSTSPKERNAVQEFFSESTERWVSLGERARTGTHTLQQSLTDYNAFLDKAKESREWLKATEDQLAVGEMVGPAVEGAQEILDANHAICSDIASKKAVYLLVSSQADKLCQGLSRREREMVQQHMQQIGAQLELLEREP
ncbi:nesprin-1-like [Acanthaster planci]|uniref:Nesprin-1-like n=1 Tax=Acanthaster planci TaxID=133434 RepID=A0A8B7YT52_ACAPL|nr:nesprin-1-like [Acanthaster planci]